AAPRTGAALCAGEHFPFGLPDCLDGLQRRGSIGPMGASLCGAALVNDGKHEPHSGWRVACGGWHLPMDAPQTSMHEALSVAPERSYDSMARRQAWRALYGTAAWSLLYRLLLASNAAALCPGRNESLVDCGNH